MIRSLTLAGLLAAAAPASAQDWSAQLTPYVWATGLGGQLTPRAGGPSLSFDRSFSEVMEDSDAAFFLSGFARRDRLVVMGDLSWSSSSRDGHLGNGLPAEGELTQRSLTLAAGYRALQDRDRTLDLLVGMRAWRVEADVSVANGVVRASHTENFIDPILAARAHFTLAPRWSALIYLDCGGFGVGSENTSQVVTTVNYQVNDRLFISGGYRRLDMDYRSGGTRLDVVMQGPLLGVTWTF